MKYLNILLAQVVGPAAVIAAGTMGAGAVASLILAGAWFRYDLLWVIVCMLPLFVIVVDSSSRIGAVNKGEGMLSIIRRHIHPSAAWLILLINIPVHILVGMGQISIMSSAFLSLFGFHPPSASAPPDYAGTYKIAEMVASVALTATILWIVLSQGYERMQKAMTALMVLMFVCFLVIAVRSFQEIDAILHGFIPNIPSDLPTTAAAGVRLSSDSILAILGSAIAPGALLAIPYMSSDNRQGALELKSDLWKSIINLGFIFGAYAIFVLIAGGFALYPLANHAEIETVHQAGQVLSRAFPAAISFVGPFIFTLGLFIAALTTLVVVLQVICYITLDLLNKPWTFNAENTLYKKLMAITALVMAALAPLWSFPALLKVVLLMGVNVVVIPLIIVAMMYLINRRSVMGEHTAGIVRNLILGVCLALSLGLAFDKAPHYLRLVLAN
ncbi:MAG: divalent metal cation transporter [Parvularculaceae bacterium]|nr:divalent metal cation transporter [Parvularculaceae bacterium]